MKFKKIICLIAAISLTLSNSSAISAEQEIGIMTEKEWEVRRSFIDENITELAAKGPEEVEEFFKKNNIQKSELMVPDIGIQSLPNSINIRSLNGYYDNISRKYFVTGYWEWNAENLLDMYAGAVDGVSLSLYQPNYEAATGFLFSSNPANISVYDQNGTLYPYAASPSNISRSGVAYTFQDNFYGPGTTKYCGYKGAVWFYMDKAPDQLPLYIKMDVNHTWQSSALENFELRWTPGKAPELVMEFGSAIQVIRPVNQTTLYSWPNAF